MQSLYQAAMADCRENFRSRELLYLLLICIAIQFLSLFSFNYGASLTSTLLPQGIKEKTNDQYNEDRLEVYKFLPYERHCELPRCQFGELCEANLRKDRQYMPSSIDDIPQNHSKYALFEDYVCKTLAVGVSVPDSSPFRDLQTVGKTLRGWMNLLIEFAFFPKVRNIIRPALYKEDEFAVSNWYWLMPSSTTCAKYLNNNLCSRQSDSKHEQKVHLLYDYSKANDAETLLFLWFYSSRLLLEKALSDCFRQRITELIEERLQSSPKTAKLNHGQAISMHIRRGDACERWTNKTGDKGNPRPCYLTELYFSAAIEMKRKYGLNTIILGTDSADAVQDSKQLARIHGFKLHFLALNRSIFNVNQTLLKTGKSEKERAFIENRFLTKEERRDIASSLFAELTLLSQGTAIIGTSLSWVSRLAFMLIGGRTERVPPYIFLDAPYVDLSTGSDITWESRLERTCHICRCK